MRAGTYVSFHAAGTGNPVASDLKYYYLMHAWSASPNQAFTFEDSHRHAAAPKPFTRELLRGVLEQRLRWSHSFVLILTPITRRDRDWVPWEIQFAVDECSLPVICAYPGMGRIPAPEAVRHLWPDPLKRRIDSSGVRAVHVPFRPAPLQAAIDHASAERLGNHAQAGVRV